MSLITCECGCEVTKKYLSKHIKTKKHTTLLNSIEKKISGDLNLICDSDLANFTKNDVIQSIQRFMAKKGGYMANLYVSKLDGLIKVINEYKIPLEDISKDKPEPNIKTKKHINLMNKIITPVTMNEDGDEILETTELYTVSLFKCGDEIDDIGFTIYWDYHDDFIDEIMSQEIERSVICDAGDIHHPIEVDIKQNMMWLEPLKKYFNWKKGQRLYFHLKYNFDGCFNVWRDSEKDYYQFVIKEDGVCFKFRTFWGDSIFRRIYKADCLYNDMIQAKKRK
ncbi:hypothetical protein T484DRAFT_3640674 [Baffinella frigidus]|nr:hypothetical protein T484DRAFT_3640674 [Cryptophyta sp. CCMP2293]